MNHKYKQLPPLHALKKMTSRLKGAIHSIVRKVDIQHITIEMVAMVEDDFGLLFDSCDKSCAKRPNGVKNPWDYHLTIGIYHTRRVEGAPVMMVPHHRCPDYLPILVRQVLVKQIRAEANIHEPWRVTVKVTGNQSVFHWAIISV